MEQHLVYTPPSPTPTQLRKRLASARKQIAKLAALKRRSKLVTIDVVAGFGLRVRTASRCPGFLYSVFTCNQLWEQDDRSQAWHFAAPTKLWVKELNRVKALLRSEDWPTLLQSLPIRAIYSSDE